MATEPRLEALLDDPITLKRGLSKKTNPSLELPPIHGSVTSHPSSRPSPLEPNASASHLAAAHGKAKSQAEARVVSAKANIERNKTAASQEDASVKQRSMRQTLDLSLDDAWITGDVDEEKAYGQNKRLKLEIGAPRKDFVKLPQLLRHNGTPTKLPNLALLSGLKTPPPNAALFPPIASDLFGDSDGDALDIDGPLALTESRGVDQSESAVPDPKPKGGVGKARRKWSKQETEDLLQGVAQHGVGKWKKILRDPAFNFNARNSIDLKDRFRTCCPEVYRKHVKSNNLQASEHASNIKAATTDRSVKMSSDDCENDPEQGQTVPAPAAPPNRSRSHRLQPDDLARMGIEKPFPIAARRERRVWTEDEDAELLKGFTLYGPLWTRIQKDPSLHLEARRPTDLRDRFRNRFPERYAEAGFKALPKTEPTPANRDAGKGEPPSSSPTLMSDMLDKRSFEDSSPDDRVAGLSAALDAPSMTAEDTALPSSTSLIDWDDTTLPPFTTSANPGGDSDIQRLLLDHIHPLLTYGPSSNARPSQASKTTPSSRSDRLAATSAAGAGFFDTAISPAQTLSSNTMHPHYPRDASARKPSLNLPPPTDLLPLDFDTAFLTPSHLSGAHVSFPNPGATSSAKVDASTSGSVAALMWEDMATHPMFDIDGGTS